MEYAENQMDYPLQDETEKIIGLAIEVHKMLGPGFLEIVYKDVFQYELEEEDILHEREKCFSAPAPLESRSSRGATPSCRG